MLVPRVFSFFGFTFTFGSFVTLDTLQYTITPRLELLDAGGRVLATSDGNTHSTPDPGSSSLFDPFLEYAFTTPGDYRVRVSSFIRWAPFTTLRTRFPVCPAQAPDPNERGWKDVVRTNPGQVTRIRAKWTLPSGVKAPQKYVFHCHILEHEDNSMMRPLQLVS